MSTPAQRAYIHVQVMRLDESLRTVRIEVSRQDASSKGKDQQLRNWAMIFRCNNHSSYSYIGQQRKRLFHAFVSATCLWAYALSGTIRRREEMITSLDGSAHEHILVNKGIHGPLESLARGNIKQICSTIQSRNGGGGVIIPQASSVEGRNSNANTRPFEAGF